MKRGFNNVLGWYRNFWNNAKVYNELVTLLQDLGPSNSALRFPDGQESINEMVDDMEVDLFIKMAKQGNVNIIVLRVSPVDVNGAIRAYSEMKKAGFNVIVEMHNEPWMGANINPPLFSTDWFWVTFFNGTLPYFRKKAAEYADWCNKTRKQFEDAGFQIEPAFTVPLPGLVTKWTEFYKVVVDKLGDWPIASFHIYGKGNELGWESKVYQGIRAVPSKFRKICTEFNGIHFGDNGTEFGHLAFGEKHRNQHNWLVKTLEDTGFELSLQHSGFGFQPDRGFIRFIFGSNFPNDRQKEGWR